MSTILSRLSVPRDWRLAVLVGGLVLPASFAVYRYAASLDGWIVGASTPLFSAVFAFITAILATAAALDLLGRRMQMHNIRMRVALDNMSQGLCMFDRNERLVVCNQRYREMYKLPAEVAKSGTSLAELLEYRIANGSFARDPTDYRRELLASMAQGPHDHDRGRPRPTARSSSSSTGRWPAAAGWRPTRTSPSAATPRASAP